MAGAFVKETEMGKSMKLDIYYDSETDTLSLWNGRPGNEGADVAENLIVDFGRDGEVIGFTLDHAAELLGPFLYGEREIVQTMAGESYGAEQEG